MTSPNLLMRGISRDQTRCIQLEMLRRRLAPPQPQPHLSPKSAVQHAFAACRTNCTGVRGTGHGPEHNPRAQGGLSNPMTRSDSEPDRLTRRQQPRFDRVQYVELPFLGAIAAGKLSSPPLEAFKNEADRIGGDTREPRANIVG